MGFAFTTEAFTTPRTQLPGKTGDVALMAWHPTVATFVVDLNDGREGRIGNFNTVVVAAPPEVTDLDIALAPWERVYLPSVLK